VIVADAIEAGGTRPGLRAGRERRQGQGVDHVGRAVGVVEPHPHLELLALRLGVGGEVDLLHNGHGSMIADPESVVDRIYPDIGLRIFTREKSVKDIPA
jgi:hypothetical protein